MIFLDKAKPPGQLGNLRKLMQMIMKMYQFLCHTIGMTNFYKNPVIWHDWKIGNMFANVELN